MSGPVGEARGVTIEEVAELIRQQSRGRIPADAPIGPETVLKDLGLSSLQLADVVFTLEERHSVEFESPRTLDVETVGDMVALANEAIGVKGPGEPAQAG